MMIRWVECPGCGATYALTDPDPSEPVERCSVCETMLLEFVARDAERPARVRLWYRRVNR